MNVALVSEDLCLSDVTMHCGKREHWKALVNSGVVQGAQSPHPFGGPMFE